MFRILESPTEELTKGSKSIAEIKSIFLVLKAQYWSLSFKSKSCLLRLKIKKKNTFESHFILIELTANIVMNAYKTKDFNRLL